LIDPVSVVIVYHLNAQAEPFHGWYTRPWYRSSISTSKRTTDEGVLEGSLLQ
jgi:hypothetical protein